MTDFYVVGETYTVPTTGWGFRVDCITTHPDDGSKTALGWRYWGGRWEPYAHEEADWDIYEHSRKVLGE